MTDEAIIEMMKQLLDSKLDNFKQDVNSQFDSIHKELTEVKQELTEVKKHTIKTESILENETNRNIKLLSETCSPMADDVRQLKDDIEVVKFDVDIVKKVVTTHSTQINQLKKAK